ncbi:MAG: hypothetical protein BWY72_01454 [Bacteroidetes bacterium ADurb.Bin416]|nr:MAG: hypothetical protein BWY72_01454 [Bacteroidetes bacterium ADurb.Bin416]
MGEGVIVDDYSADITVGGCTGDSTPGVVGDIQVDGGGDTEGTIVLDKITLDLDVGRSRSKVDAISAEVVDEVVVNQDVGNRTRKMDTIGSGLPRTIDLEAFDADIGNSGIDIDTVGAIGRHALGAADAFSGDAGVIRGHNEARAGVLDDSAVLEQDGEMGVINLEPAGEAVGAGRDDDGRSGGSVIEDVLNVRTADIPGEFVFTGFIGQEGGAGLIGAPGTEGHCTADLSGGRASHAAPPVG